VSPTLIQVRCFSDTSLGSVYLGRDIRTGADVALKMGLAPSLPSTLHHEYKVYTSIAGSVGTSTVLWFGREDVYEVIVLEYLGNSIGDLINEEKFNPKKAFLYASQMVCSWSLFTVLMNTVSHVQLSAIESLHTRHFIHRDIKPTNFMVQADGSPPTVFLIDFGLARLFRDPATLLHCPYTTGHLVVGTLPFISINGQQGFAQSRRDDLESLAYTIIYMACGDLPWSNICACRDYEAVLRKKESITTEELCEGLPAPFYKFFTHVRSLGFDENPDYRHLHTILSRCSETEFGQPAEAPPFTVPSPVSVRRTPVLRNRM